MLAFPVHSPAHWTLGLLVNLAWTKDDKKGVPEWMLFHFDSHPTNVDYPLIIARHFAKCITGVKHRRDISIKDVPVPGQKTHSNDCGLWPAHYLKVILQDPDFIIDFCRTVSQSLFNNRVAEADWTAAGGFK